jgi:hypothetical protein
LDRELTGDDGDDKQVVQETELVNRIVKIVKGLMMTLRPKEQRRHRQADLQGYLGDIWEKFFTMYIMFTPTRALFFT